MPALELRLLVPDCLSSSLTNSLASIPISRHFVMNTDQLGALSAAWPKTCSSGTKLAPLVQKLNFHSIECHVRRMVVLPLTESGD